MPIARPIMTASPYRGSCRARTGEHDHVLVADGEVRVPACSGAQCACQRLSEFVSDHLLGFRRLDVVAPLVGLPSRVKIGFGEYRPDGDSRCW